MSDKLVMLFNLKVLNLAGETIDVPIAAGEAVFVVGANGTGKSSLVQSFAANAGHASRRISASRQTWFQSSSLDFSPSQKNSYEEQVRNWDRHYESRYKEQHAHLRSSLTLYDLIDAENRDSRAIAKAMRDGNVEEATRLSSQMAPIDKINELLSLSNIPIEISVKEGDKLVASKNGSEVYGAAELSDGERNALLIAADVLTAKPGTLLIIDEPERHLHRSIISPLLSQLFRFRNDCAFVVATHDLLLPVDSPDARVLLIRSCSYSGGRVQSWDLDILPANADLDERLKEDIVGARRQILFIEGEESSLDKPIYSILFPGVSVRAKGASRGVEQSVGGVRASESLHWLKAWGIVDSDGRDADAIRKLEDLGIFALPFYSVESIYYHPEVIRGVAKRQAIVVGGDGESRANSAIAAASAAALLHLDRLAARAVEKRVRRMFFDHLPTVRTIQNREAIAVEISTATVVDAEATALSDAIKRGDWLYILTRCPVRETPALDIIARELGLRDRHQYESAVLQMLREDIALLNAVRAFFGDLPRQLGIN